jgi:hypothetical protein
MFLKKYAKASMIVGVLTIGSLPGINLLADSGGAAEIAVTAADAGPSDLVANTTDVAHDVDETSEAGPDNVPDLSEALSAVTVAWKAYKDAQPGTKTAAVVVLLAAITWFLVAVAKRFFGAMRWYPWVALGAGVITGFAAYYGANENLLSAVLLGGGPPLAVLIQELLGKYLPTEPPD